MSSPNEDTPSIAKQQPETASPNPPDVAWAVDGQDLRIGLQRGVKARHLPENLAERGTCIHLGRFVNRTDLKHHPTVLQLFEPA